MKNLIYFLSMLILFQSCYSYKTFNINEYKKNKAEKLKVKLTNNQIIKGKPISYIKDTLMLKKIIGTEKIPKSEIKKIQKRKFSILKTYLLSSAISLSALLILLNEMLKSI
jgi:hypothetical protein